MPNEQANLVREQLDRIIASKDFDASDRNRRFLDYVVSEALCGRGYRIKAYNIATTVFGRDERFDPQLDSIVRIEAGRLRRSLVHYYLTAGKDDPVLITMPPGAYVPKFENVADLTRDVRSASLQALPSFSQPARAMDATSPVKRPTVCVAPFEAEGTDPLIGMVSRSCSRQFMVEMSRYAELFVHDRFDSPESARDGGRSGSGGSPCARFLVSGSTSLQDRILCVIVLLLDVSTGRYLWADRLELCSISAPVQLLCSEIVQEVARPHGVIHQKLMVAIDAEPSEEVQGVVPTPAFSIVRG
jgi:adenylate cyclase